MSTNIETVWHNDGHKIRLTLDHSDVRVDVEPCTHSGDDPCRHPIAGCVVEYFIRLFGLECNVGVAPASPVMEIGWSLHGNPNDLDACQLWFIAREDSIYASWVESQQDV